MSRTVTRGTRGLVIAGVAFFACWQIAAALELGRGAGVALGVYGFVFHVFFGKAYALVPSYFDRELAVPRAPLVQLPLSAGGTVCLFAAAIDAGSAALEAVGRVAWLLGCLVFLGTVGWTIRDNLLGGQTGTGEVNAHRRRVDRIANGFVPIAFAYLLAGATVPVLGVADVAVGPLPTGGPAATHLLVAGTAALGLFAVGFRLLPRFLVAEPRLSLVAVVLPAGALGPLLLATDFLGDARFRAGAVLQALAVVGFAVAYADMYYRSDREAVAFRGVLAGVLCGVAAVALGLHVAFAGPAAGALDAHYRLASTGFLGLTIVGVSYRFYPPAIAPLPGGGDRAATASIAALVGGLALEAGGLLAGHAAATAIGRGLALLGATIYAVVLYALFLERRG